MDTIKYLLPESDVPKAWYNIVADLHVPPPMPLHPGTGQPLTAAELEPIFARELIAQEMSAEREIEIPGEVRQLLAQWRPTPLCRARRLERALGTPARIYYKYEGTSPSGSHKFNTALPQVYFNKAEGTKRITTETGAGQWGSALSIACSMFDIPCDVFMVKVSFGHKPYRKALMETFGGRCIASPSMETECGRAILASDPECPGSLGIAISEAVELAVRDAGTKYCLGSVLNHVLLHQTVIGLDCQKQFVMADDRPDIVIGCTGGGSNFAGIAFPFIGDGLRGGPKARVIAVEPSACPSLTKGRYAYDFGDTGKLTPLVKMHTLGSAFIPPAIHTGGLRYHGMAPLVSHVQELGLIESRSVAQSDVFRAGVMFAKAEGILPAPEAAHAVAAVVDEAVRCREEGISKSILVNLCGHGHFDMTAYMKYAAGELEDYDYPAEEIAMALAGLPPIGKGL
jgi:tryptophan synthase beta chain